MIAREKYGQNEQTSWALLESSGVDLLVATAFPDPVSGDQTDPVVNGLITTDITRYTDFVAHNTNRWQVVHTALDITSSKKKLVLHIEGLNALEPSATSEQLTTWYDLGVRSIAPWWNIDNALGGGTNSPTSGLTSLGQEVVQWIETNKCILDLAHAGRQTFSDVAKITTRPLYISHGNADTVCPSVRNYTDEQLRLIAETDGVIGVFFPATFTIGAGMTGTVFDVVRHIIYIRDLVGVRHIAIGSDFGGIVSGTLEGLVSVSDFPTLITALSSVGFTDDDIEAICVTNAKRILFAHLS
jgi:membrane dipeptidase